MTTATVLLRSIALPFLLLLPGLAAAQVTQSTGTVSLDVFGNGFIGAGPVGVGGAGFTFAGENGLYIGQLLIGAGPTQISGQPSNTDEWTQIAAPVPVTPPAGFDQAYEATFTDASAPDPIGIEVTQWTYSRAGDPFILVEYEVANPSASATGPLYVGVFADWDVALDAQDLADYDAGTRLVYAWNPGAGNLNYYGVAALTSNAQDVSGYAFTLRNNGAGATDAQLFTAMTTPEAPPAATTDLWTLIASGPYTLGAGERAVARFAFVGGADEAGIIANAAAAQAVFPVANEAGPRGGRALLAAVHPNPTADAATVSFTLASPGRARLAVYDVLGREVAVLAEGAKATGEHAVSFDASKLPPGLYVLRLTTPGSTASRRLTVVR